MHRALRVGDYWNWLPTFRVVAETNNLRDAAERMHVAPSAISRTIRLLESSLGYPLFERTSGALQLNAAGHQLLEGVRAAMRIVNESHGERREPAACHIHCPPDLVTVLVDALPSWMRTQPESPPIVHVPCDEDVTAQLLRGDLDIALSFDSPMDMRIEARTIGEVSSSIYCAPSHPACRLAKLTDEELQSLPILEHPVGPLSFLRLARGQEPRRVAYLPSMAAAVQLAVHGLGVVCVPDFVVAHSGVKLTRLPVDLPKVRLYVWFRRTLQGLTPPPIVEYLATNIAFPRFGRSTAV
jgi:DNA-binding transcriptional LysR family regulator